MKIKKKINIRALVALIVLTVLISICIALLLFSQQISKVTILGSDEMNYYENYFVIVADDSDSILWESIYQGAYEAGIEEANAYVEFVDINSSTGYTLQEKMRIAIDSGVDGIILCSDGEEETTALIDEAAENGIPVVTALSDDSTSMRQCYVGINNYSLGETYGTIVWEYLNLETEIGED
ncbi:MAG: substrate-binding domain-containing protein [Eubacteriales bacterium]